MDQRKKKLMTMHKTLHPRDDVDRLYVSRREGGGGLTSIEYIFDESTQRLDDYREQRRWRLITATKHNTNDS